MKTRRISEQPFRQICDDEWNRSKKLLFPVLKKKPKFLWVAYRGKRTATAYRWKNTLEFTEKYLKNFGKYPIESFILVVRHEIAHLASDHGHGSRFQQVVKILGGSQFRTWDFMKMKPTSYGEPLLKDKN